MNSSRASSVDEVLAHLESIWRDAMRERSRAGYFAAVYYRITQAVKQRIDSGGFVDANWVSELDVVFANRYFAAYTAYRSRQPGGRAWTLAFDAALLRRPVILQHVVLGINAHINYDLGIATAQVGDIASHRADFDTVNRCAADEVARLQRQIGTLSPLTRVVDDLNGRKPDGSVVNFAVDRARDQAWEAAQLLTYAPEDQHATELDVLDRNAAALGRLILDPPGAVLKLGLRSVRAAELHSVPSVIESLAK